MQRLAVVLSAAGLAVLCLPAFAEEPGFWVLTDRLEEIQPDSSPNCRTSGETQDQGAIFSRSCFSPVSNETIVTSAHVSWSADLPLERLWPTDVMHVEGVVENTGTPNKGPSADCVMLWNTWGFTTSDIVAPGSSGKCTGDLPIPARGMRPSGEYINEARLIELVEFGNGAWIRRHLIYEWQPAETGEIGH